MHVTGTDLEFDSGAVDGGDGVEALVAGGFGGADVVFEGVGEDGKFAQDGGQGAVGVEFIFDDDAHAVDVVEF